jgi:diguanylate cyclase (GGDEF)-like protein
MSPSSWQANGAWLGLKRRLARADEETAKVRATLQTALDATTDGFAVLDVDHDRDGSLAGLRLVHANAAARAGCDLTLDQMVGRDVRESFSWFMDTGMTDQILASLAHGRPHQRRVHSHDEMGGWTTSRDLTVAPVGPHRVVLTFRDVTIDERARRDQDLARRRAEHDAVHDPLTGLANRVLLRERLQQALVDCPPGTWIAVVYCDLDGFKQINDAHGHDAGDTILRTTADRLRQMIRPDDTAARVGGDEFSLILRNLPPGWDSAPLVSRIADRLGEPVYVHGRRLTPSASIGVAVADPHALPGSDRNAVTLLTAADQSMYRDKTTRRIRRRPT